MNIPGTFLDDLMRPAPWEKRQPPRPPKDTATATAEDDWRREIADALDKLDSKQLRHILDRCRVWTRGR